MRGKKLGAAVAVVGIAIVGGAVAGASIPDSNGVIHSCYAKTGGALRVIDTQNLKTGRCAKDETALAWNQQGPAGPAATPAPPPALESKPPFRQLGPTDATVASLTLPAGNWVVWAKGQLMYAGSSLDQCELRRNGVRVDRADVQTANSNASVPVVLQGMVGSNGSTQISMDCRANDTDRLSRLPVAIFDIDLVAIEVTSAVGPQ